MIPRNALIFHSGGLGDFVLTWPLGLALGRIHPQSRIIYVTQSSKGALAAAAIGLDFQDAETSWPAFYAPNPAVPDRLRKTLAETHSVFTFLFKPGDTFSKNIAQLAPVANVYSLRLPPPDNFTASAAEFLLSQLTSAPVLRTAIEQILVSIRSKGVRNRPPLRSGAPILLHPGAGHRDKCYPLAGFLTLAERILATGKTVKILLGEVELERLPAADIRRLESAAPLARPAQYVDLLAQLSAAAAFIGNDSGPTHLAAITGVPTIALFGPTNPVIWRPLGPRIQVLHSPNWTDLSPVQVFQTLEQLPETGI
jgi:ADP-heptose:LPS heptosyltransferase